MATNEPTTTDASADVADDLSDILDDGPLTDEDIEAIRAHLDNPVAVPDELIKEMLDARLSGERWDEQAWEERCRAAEVRASPETVLAWRAELDRLEGRTPGQK